MARQFIYHMQGLSKTYPGNRKVLENIHLSFYPDAKIGVLGVNGSGKSTLLRIMAGIDKEFTGEGWVSEGARVGYLQQEPQLDATKTVRENVMEGVAPQKAILDRYNELAVNYSDENADEMTKLQDEIEAKGLWDLDSKVDQAMDALRCPPDDADVAKLSGGERRRVALCRLLLEQPELLLLDEPTNHLDAESVQLARRPSAQLSRRHPDRHPRPLLPRQRHRLDPRARSRPRHSLRGQLLGLALAEAEAAGAGGPRGRGAPAHARARAGMDRGVPARAAGEVQGALSALRGTGEAGRGEDRPRPRRSSFRWRSGSVRTSSTSRVSPRAFGDNLLIDDLTFKLPPGGIVGVIGPNGAGKTTLFRMITGQEKPDKGTIKIGESVHLGYVDQSRDALDGKKNVWEEISGGNDIILLGKREVNSRAYCSNFNFKGADQQKKVGSLSGGERNRVHLAKMLKSGANLLLLDEPTNDLDVDTLRALEEALEDFAGCAVIISHDRWFLDRIATHILAFEGDSHVEWFEGNFQDYEQDKMRRLGTDSTIPHRIKYKKFSR